MKKALTLIGTVSAAFAIAIPAQASFDSWAAPQAKAKPSHPAKVTAKRIVKEPRPSVLCICTSGPVTAAPALTEEQIEAQYDQDLIEHGLDPVYHVGPATDAATNAAPAAVDAVPLAETSPAADTATGADTSPAANAVLTDDTTDC